MSESQDKPISIAKWIEENSKFFVPPVCNKLMYGAGQLKMMYVGGPNIRKDYHLELGEELFYQHKGDMCLPVVEKGVPKLVPIKEGEILILPARIPHSPQRYENTVGLVIERERLEDELDGLRWYCETRPDWKTNPSILYQEVFHCYDLGVQLKPVIGRFFASKQCATGEPQSSDDPNEPGNQQIPWDIDVETEVPSPICLSKWIEDRADAFQKGETVRMYGGKSRKGGRDEFEVDVVGGKGEDHTEHHDKRDLEVLFWQLKNSMTLKIDNGEEHEIKEGEVYLLKRGLGYTQIRPKGSIGLVIVINPYHYQREAK